MGTPVIYESRSRARVKNGLRGVKKGHLLKFHFLEKIEGSNTLVFNFFPQWSPL